MMGLTGISFSFWNGESKSTVIDSVGNVIAVPFLYSEWELIAESFWIDGMTVNEIAEEMNLRPVVVQKILARMPRLKP